MKNYNKILKSRDFTYLIGAFMADGCFYIKDKKYLAFEFYDGSFVKKELKYSLEHLNNIKSILLKYFEINPLIKIRGNLYILYFKSKELADTLTNIFFMKPGKKASIVDIPSIYKNTNLEKYFWLGFMDGDGMVARNSRKVVLDISSKSLINSFKDFLNRNNIGFKYSERIIKNKRYFRVCIPSLFIKDYYNKISFNHPRKKIWIEKHIKREFYKRNIINFNRLYKNNILNYKRLFLNTNAYVENGLNLIKKYNINYKSSRHRRNIQFSKLHKILNSGGLSDKKINKELSNFKWKMGKGSKYSVKLPYFFNKDLYEISKIIRPNNYSIRVSRNYSKLLNLNYNNTLKKINNLFEIKPTFTNHGEPIYCSGIIGLFFSNIISYEPIINN